MHTGVDTKGIYALSQLVQERSGIPVTANKAIVGRNAFRHASGIHQDGVLKHRLNFECIDPADIGHPVGTEIVLGKLSGTAGFAAKARQLGYDLRGPQLHAAFAAFQAVAGPEARHLGRRSSGDLREGVRLGLPGMLCSAVGW